MRVLLTGGGTAGHINPALAIAETVLQHAPDSEIAFVGIKNGKETDLVPREGYPLHFVKSKGIDRDKKKWSPANIEAYWLALTSPYSPRTTRILRNFKPDIVIGTGGFACWPIMAAAARMGIPTAVHESNALPGLAVRMLQDRVDRIWINFPNTAERLTAKEKIVKIGNPLRRGFGTLSYADARRQLGIAPHTKLILSFGGSLGAEEVNRAAVEMMRAYSSKSSDVLHVHATGKRDYEETKKSFDQYGLNQSHNCILTDYIYDMPVRMAAADLVISRAGAMTLSELALMQKSCVLIPSPYVTDNHQYLNAKALADAGAAELIEEKTLKDGTLIPAATKILNHPLYASSMQRAIRTFADAEANERIWNQILELTASRK